MAATDRASCYESGVTKHHGSLLGWHCRLFTMGWKAAGLEGERRKVLGWFLPGCCTVRTLSYLHLILKVSKR